jgi:hypothetical protein
VITSFVGALRGTPAFRRYPPRLANASMTVVEARAGGPVTLFLTNHVGAGMPTPAP